MNLLGIICSPRELGNCELAVKEIGRQLGPEHRLKLLRLSDFNIGLCTGCYRCLFGRETCVLDDDLPVIIEAMAEAEGIIVAAPTYLLGANASLKLLLDRGLAFYARRRDIWQKPALAVGVSGIAGKEGGTMLELDRFMNFLLAEKRDLVMLNGALPGEIFLNDSTTEKLSRAAAAFASGPAPPAGPACELCGGNTFRFESDGRVKCMHCSNTGTVDFSSNQLRFNIQKDDHGIFLSREEAEEHLEWLKNMKQKYIENRKRLREIKSAYLGDWSWIKPPGRGD